MNRNQIAVITSLATPPATPVQRQTRSGARYAGTPPAESPQANVRRCQHCRQPRKGHKRSGCPNVDPPIPPSSPVNEASRQTKPRTPVSSPGYNVINQQQVNVNVHYHASPTALFAPSPEESEHSDEHPSSPSTGDLSESGDSTPSRTPNDHDDRWDLIHALLRADPKAVVTRAVAQDDLATEELIAEDHGYAVKVIYPEDSWEDPSQGLFIVARDAAALRGPYNRSRRAAKSGTPLASIVREESHMSLGDVVETVVDAMAGLEVGGSKPRVSRKPRKSRKST